MSKRQIFSLFGAVALEGMGKTQKELTEFNKEVRGATRRLNKMGREFITVGKNMTRNITAPMAAAGAAMVALSNKTGKYADQLLDLQQVTGLSTDNLQGLEVVSRDAGVSFEGLTGVIGKFTSRLPQIQRGTGQASRAMDQLGVSVHDSDGNMRDMNELFPVLVRKLQSIESVTERNALSQQIFGRSLEDIAPVLGMASDEFDRLMGSAEDVAGYMDKDALKAANEYRKSMENLKADFGGLTREMAMAFIPVLKNSVIPAIRNKVVPAIRGMIKAIKGAVEWFQGLNPAIKEIAVVLGVTLAAVGPLTIAIGKMVLAAKALVPLYIALTKGQIALNLAMKANPIGLIITAITALVAAGVLLYRNWDAVTDFMSSAWDSLTFHVEQGALRMQEVWAKSVLVIIDGIRRISDYIPGLNDAVFDARDAIEDMMFAAQGARMVNEAERESLEAKRKATADATEATADATDATSESTDATVEETETTKMSTAAKQNNAQAEKNLTWERYKAIDAVVAVHNALEKAKEDAKRILEERAQFEEQWSEKLFRETNDRIAILEMEKDQSLQQAYELGAEEASIREYFLHKIRDAKEQEAEASVQASRREVQEKIGLAQQLHSGVSAIMSDLSNMRMVQMENEIEKRRQQIEHSMMGEEEKEEAFTALEAEAAERKDEMRKKEAKQEKALRLFEIGINTASAVAQALPNVVLAGIVGTMGAAQAAIVAATPIPLAQGATVQSDPGRGVLAQIGEGNQDEIVMPLKSGIDQIVSGIISGLRDVTMPRPAFAGMPSGGGGDVHLSIGTLVADERGLKNLERRMSKYRIRENQRTGR